MQSKQERCKIGKMKGTANFYGKRKIVYYEREFSAKGRNFAGVDI